MSFINYSSREINCKIVYYGPGLCGKTTNLQHIYNKTNPDVKGKMISLATETERTLFFDFLPLALGEIRGFKTRFHLYTVPGQVFYDASRKLILKGVDGVVFVADSQIERMEANVESLSTSGSTSRSKATSSAASPSCCSTTSGICPTQRRWKRCGVCSIRPACPITKLAPPRARASSRPSRQSPRACSRISRRWAVEPPPVSALPLIRLPPPLPGSESSL